MHPSSSFNNMQLVFIEAFKNMIIYFSRSLISMQGICHDVLIYFKAKLDTKLIKDAPSFCENSMLLKKQSLKVCKPRDLIWVQWVPWASPSLWSSPLLDFSWCGVLPFPVKKLQHKTFFTFFSMVQWYHACCYFPHK